MKIKIIKWLITGYALSSFSAYAGDFQNEIQVSLDKTQDPTALVVKNSNVFPVTLSLQVTGENIDSKCLQKACRFVVLPKQSKTLMQVPPKDATKSWSVGYSYYPVIGKYEKSYDKQYPYLLPFKHGSKHRLTQGFNGDFSHKGDSKYAMDFAMPIGTPIYAARSGKVVSVIEHNDKGGASDKYLPYSNSIKILHKDGTIASYAHLNKNGAIVKVGDSVVRGQHIGLSGNTGKSTGPHLHFHVTRLTKDARREVIPFVIKGRHGKLETPSEKYYYSVHNKTKKVKEVYADEIEFGKYIGKSKPIKKSSKVEFRTREIDDYIMFYLQNGHDKAIDAEIDFNITGYKHVVPFQSSRIVKANHEMLITVIRPAIKEGKLGYSYGLKYREID